MDFGIFASINQTVFSMAGVNKVMLIGNLGKDPEVKYLEGGVAVAKFPLATSESYKDKTGKKVDQTEWHNVVFWRGLAEIAEKYLKKGMQVYVEGKIRTRSWQDKEGNKRYSTEIVGDNLTILGRREDNSSGAATSSPDQGEDPISTNEPADDLPF